MKKRLQNLTILSIFAFSMIMLSNGVLAESQSEIPILPIQYEGTVTIDDQPAPIGTIISADVNGEQIATNAPGGIAEAGYYRIDISAPETTTIILKINGIAVGQYTHPNPMANWHIVNNLTLNTSNYAPNAPTNISPSNNATNISISPTLTVAVSDPNSDSMNVTFYNAENNSVIGTANNIGSGSNASITWSGLTNNHTYRWYVIVNDGKFNTRSSTWSFTTIGTSSSNTTGGGSTGGSGSSANISTSSNIIATTTSTDLDAKLNELKAKIAELQNKINQLLGKSVPITIATPTVTTPVVYERIPTGFKFAKTLKFGMTDEDVKYLQIMLNSDPDTRLALSGVGSLGNETTYFGPLTKAAVIKFQEKYKAEILTPQGLTSGTGLVANATRAKLNQLLGK